MEVAASGVLTMLSLAIGQVSRSKYPQIPAGMKRVRPA
jgi:hypothetical protein